MRQKPTPIHNRYTFICEFALIHLKYGICLTQKDVVLQDSVLDFIETNFVLGRLAFSLLWGLNQS